MLVTGGRIINLASMLSFLGGFNTTAYTASKHAVMGLTRVMASEWGHLWINVNAIAADDLNAFHEMREQGYLSDRYLLYGHKSRCELYGNHRPINKGVQTLALGLCVGLYNILLTFFKPQLNTVIIRCVVFGYGPFL